MIMSTRFPPNETPMMPMGKPKRPKRIEAHSTEELGRAISRAIDHCDMFNIDFFVVLHGIDAYMERRKRRDAERLKNEADEAQSAAEAELASDAMWGGND
jgi:hypothetical protein